MCQHSDEKLSLRSVKDYEYEREVGTREETRREDEGQLAHLLPYIGTGIALADMILACELMLICWS